jgi:pimeloyl-ACP methyl ester carboxylesterase
MKPTIQFVKRKDGVRLAYSIFGQGPTLIYPAPWVTNLAFFLEDQVSLKFWMTLANYFRIVVYDKHGCGQSDRDRKGFTPESDLFDLTTINLILGATYNFTPAPRTVSILRLNSNVLMAITPPKTKASKRV